MIPVLRKVAQLNIKYKKNGGPIINVCTGAPLDEVTALQQLHYPSTYPPKQDFLLNNTLSVLP